MADIDVKKYQEQFEALQENLPEVPEFKTMDLSGAKPPFMAVIILVAVIIFGTLGGLTYWALH